MGYLTDSGILQGLLAFVGGLVGLIIAWRTSWKAVAELRAAEAAEWKRKHTEVAKENAQLRCDYHQTLEFNVQDREMINILVDEIIRLCPTAREDAATILYAARLKVKAGAQRRLLTEGIHMTKDASAEGDR